jgi:hypothetical protein
MGSPIDLSKTSFRIVCVRSLIYAEKFTAAACEVAFQGNCSENGVVRIELNNQTAIRHLKITSLTSGLKIAISGAGCGTIETLELDENIDHLLIQVSSLTVGKCLTSSESEKRDHQVTIETAADSSLVLVNSLVAETTNFTCRNETFRKRTTNSRSFDSNTGFSSSAEQRLYIDRENRRFSL